jgi:hypothetical protein
MRVVIATHASWFILPALQFTARVDLGTICGQPNVLPWTLVLWWGKRGLQLEGKRDEPTLGEEVR